jgi:hypothetical protein
MPAARARWMIESLKGASAISGNKVTMSMRIAETLAVTTGLPIPYITASTTDHRCGRIHHPHA